MRLSALFFHTAKEAPNDAESAADRLLRRGGFFGRVGQGIPVGAPALARTLRAMERIAREKLDAIGAQEILAPALRPRAADPAAEPAPDLAVSFGDRASHALSADPLPACLELALHAARGHRSFPLALYHAGPRFAAPEKPGPGLLRLHESRAVAACALALDGKGSARMRARILNALLETASACGIAPVAALAGPDDAPDAECEIACPHDSGETQLLRCAECRTAFLRDACPAPAPAAEFLDYGRPMETIPTPAIRSVEELVRFTGIGAHQMVKTILCRAERAGATLYAAALMRGDLAVSERKLARALGAQRVALCTAEEVTRLTGAAVGFAGPFGLPPSVRLLADPSAAACRDFLCGLNRTDLHNIQVRFGRDLPLPEVANLRLALEGERCPACGEGRLALAHAIPLGHARDRGDAPAEALNYRVTGARGETVHPHAASAELDLFALLTAVAETRRDRKGVVLPEPIAPWPVAVIPAGSDPGIARAAELAYAALRRAGVDALLDDREASAGAKFADAGLLGVPRFAIAGRAWLAEGKFEIEDRRDGTRRLAAMEELVGLFRAPAPDPAGPPPVRPDPPGGEARDA